MNDNNITMMVNMGWILSPIQMLCWMLFSDKLISWRIFLTLLSDLYYDHSVKSTDLTAQCSRFLFLYVYGPKISTTLKRIAQIYLPYLPPFVSLGLSRSWVVTRNIATESWTNYIDFKFLKKFSFSGEQVEGPSLTGHPRAAGKGNNSGAHQANYTAYYRQCKKNHIQNIQKSSW